MSLSMFTSHEKDKHIGTKLLESFADDAFYFIARTMELTRIAYSELENKVQSC